jgi:hypothetical protein
MTETWGLPGERVIAEGREAVISYLESLGEPDFAIDTYLDVQEETEWTAGIVLDDRRAIPEDELWTVTLRGSVYRIEAGSRDLYYAQDEGEDEDEDESPASDGSGLDNSPVLHVHNNPVTGQSTVGSWPCPQCIALGRTEPLKYGKDVPDSTSVTPTEIPPDRLEAYLATFPPPEEDQEPPRLPSSGPGLVPRFDRAATRRKAQRKAERKARRRNR